MKKRILFLAFSALIIALIFGLGGVSAQYYGNHYGHGGTHSYQVIKASPYYSYQKNVYSDPWSYSSNVRRINYGNGYYPRYNYGYSGHNYGYGYPSYGHGYSNYYSQGYYNSLGNYFHSGYHPPQYVAVNRYRSYY